MPHPDDELGRLRVQYDELLPAVESRLEDFEATWECGTDESIFRELVFCLLTPQSKARSCWSAVERLTECNLITEGAAAQISENLRGVRFHHTKARRVVGARKHLDGLKARIAGFESPIQAREWLANNVVGMSYKEASHFLRNIGMGRDLAILDRHILKNLVLLGVIIEIPKSLSPKRYLEIEQSMREFCRKNGFGMADLDMVLWCREAGEVFK
jgi:N-glycosylase/DNA lyase